MESFMSNKKSYMNQSNLINEGFFDNLSKFLKNRISKSKVKIFQEVNCEK